MPALDENDFIDASPTASPAHRVAYQFWAPIRHVIAGAAGSIYKTDNTIVAAKLVARLASAQISDFVAHVAEVSRGNAQANAVNSTDLAWSRLVRDQEVGGSNPLARPFYLGTATYEREEKRRIFWL